MKYTPITQQIISELKDIVGLSFVFVDDDNLKKYSHDETEDLSYLPEIVVKPNSPEQISQILQLCNKLKISLTPSGARTGLSGGALPIEKGIVLSMERFNKILLIDEKNLQATVEPGVITQIFQESVIEKGLFYPPDPSSRGSCSIGGNLAQCAGGPKAVKYGVTRDYVLNLEVVLPTGEIIWTGANVLKNSTGYNFTHLMIGSEGTLGIITKVVFRLIPYPAQTLLMLAPFYSAEKACEAVSAIFRAGMKPSALEFMERDAIDWVCKFENITLTIDDNIQAHLLVEVDGNDGDVLMKECEVISEVLSNYECGEILFADSEAQKAELWKMRRKVAEAVKAHSVYKEEDTVVPRYELPKLLKSVKEIGAKYGFQSVCYGHAGDGNLHVNIIKGELPDEVWNNTIKDGIKEIFESVVALGGTISGEHGIGLVQKEFMPIALDAKRMELMKGIKLLFDPNYILNPGKIFD